MSTEYARQIIEEIRAALKGIVLKHDHGQDIEAASDLNARCLESIGLDLPQVLAFSPERLRDFLEMGGALRVARSLALAEILLLDASIHESAADFERTTVENVHAFCLIADNLAALDDNDKEAYRTKLHRLAGRLQNLKSSPYIAEKLQRYNQLN